MRCERYLIKRLAEDEYLCKADPECVDQICYETVRLFPHLLRKTIDSKGEHRLKRAKDSMRGYCYQ